MGKYLIIKNIIEWLYTVISNYRENINPKESEVVVPVPDHTDMEILITDRINEDIKLGGSCILYDGVYIWIYAQMDEKYIRLTNNPMFLSDILNKRTAVLVDDSVSAHDMVTVVENNTNIILTRRKQSGDVITYCICYKYADMVYSYNYIG